MALRTKHSMRRCMLITRTRIPVGGSGLSDVFGPVPHKLTNTPLHFIFPPYCILFSCQEPTVFISEVSHVPLKLPDVSSAANCLRMLLVAEETCSMQFCLDDILRWFAQMCAGAKHIHKKRVLHIDLKSKNIFLTDNGTIKLGDFGSACILNSSKAYAQTYVGTPYYVAPELWDNKPYNNKSDVWSLGCVLYELCPLRHPFQATSWKSLILKVCRGAYPPLPEHLPYELRYLVKHMFKTNPKDRPSLQTILTSHRVSKLLRSHSPSQVMEAEEQGRRSCRWNREEGKKVAQLLGEKSLIITSTFEGCEMSEEHGTGDSGDFEEESPCNWIEEVERMFSEH
ncbi:unnamed protein product [Pleuronectes platessa]|uniref:Protein kinase domain-containing protein n=1 Tax=Pleuronectes platessa TaxID=8262 RepID=A0A9N7VK58_PLEPL|nr:unnamed protein product [Pleuronectes platessa]